RSFDDMVSGQNRNFRRNVRRARAAAETLGLGFAVYEGRDAVGGLLKVVDRVARASWKHEGREGTDVNLSYEGQQQRYFETLLLDSELGATPVLAIATLEDDPIGVELALRYRDALMGLLMFRDERCDAA